MRFIILTLLGLIPARVLAQAFAPLSVDAAVARAIRHNPRLSAAARDITAARSGLRSAQTLTNPEVVFTPGLSPGGSDEELLVRQPLEINGTRAARAGLSNARLRGAQARAVVELRTLVFDTKAAYSDLIRAQEQLALARQTLQFAEELDRLAHRQVELGARPGVEAAQTGIEAMRARLQVTHAEVEATAARAVLNTRMGSDPAAPVEVAALPPLASTPLEREPLLRQALAARAEITIEEAEAEAFRQEARLVRAEGVPDLAPQFRATGLTRGVSDAGVGIGITLPLLDYGSRRYRIQQAEDFARAQADRLAAVRSEVRQEVELAIARLRAAEEAVKSYRQGVLEQSRRVVQASQIGFQEGKTSLLQVLEAQRTFRSVQSEYVDAQVRYAVALAELERATGAVASTLLREAVR